MTSQTTSLFAGFIGARAMYPWMEPPEPETGRLTLAGKDLRVVLAAKARKLLETAP